MLVTAPAAPPAGRTAWLLDLDGTLLDIAPAPDLVVVPPGLIETLHGLRRRDADAVAVVTGRPVAQVEALLGDAPFAIAGEHGAALRAFPGAPVHMADLPHVPAAWRSRAEALVAAAPGTRFEPKAHGFVLHYRGAPDQDSRLRAALDDMVADSGAFVILPAKMAWEIRARGVDKGGAVRALMALPPFAGRVPVFAGDDVTDEDGIQVAESLGGHGLRIGNDVDGPAAFRDWLRGIAFTAG